MNCSQCLKELPFNPRNHAQINGRILDSLCKYCQNSVNGKADLSDLEGRVLFLEEIEPQWTKKQWDTVQELRGQVLYLQEQVKKESTKERKLINIYSKE